MSEILVFGETGQVARQLKKLGQNRVICMGRAALDIRDADSVRAVVLDLRPQVVINAAAFTAVDKAEEVENEALAVNGDGAAHIAMACGEIPLIHISTDYVFDGTACEPYSEDAPVCPVNAYGRSKLAGEEAVRRHAPNHVILRTAWVYSYEGNNFVRTVLRLMTERYQLGIVDDQCGCPTSAQSIGEAILYIAHQLETGTPSLFGTYHYVDGGETTWYGFACEIYHAAQLIKGLSSVLKDVDIQPITTAQYPLPANRPTYSVLSTRKFETTFDFPIRMWQDRLEECLQAISRQPEETL